MDTFVQEGAVELEDFHWLMDILQSLDVGLVVLDKNYNIQLWNGFMENFSGIHGVVINNHNIFEEFPELPQSWLKRKVEDAVALQGPVFNSWEQKPYLFKFTSARPFTGLSSIMYQNITVMPLRSIHGTISHVCIIIYDVTESATNQLGLQDANEKLRTLSITDGLTKLYNRAYWQECLAQEYNRFKRKSINVTLMMMGIDFFKKVNDTYGHPAGDEVLRTLSKILKSQLRATDVAGRYGGEEFAVILLDSDIEKSMMVAERVRKAVEAHTVYYEDLVINFTLSVGLCQLTHSIESAQDWLVNTDNCLYYSKEHGRNRVTAFGINNK